MVAAGFDFDADKHAVALAKADNVGDAAAALGVEAVAAGFGVVDADGVLALHGEALQGEVGQDGAGGFAGRGQG